MLSSTSGAVSVDPDPNVYRGIRASVPLSKFEVSLADWDGWFGVVNIYMNGGYLEGFPSIAHIHRHYREAGIWVLKYEPVGAPPMFISNKDNGFPALFSSKELATAFLDTIVAA